MGWMSARRIGKYLKMSAQQVNEELKDRGFLEGEPGAYSLTERGEEYGQDHEHDNGYGGSAHRQWSTRSWASEIIPQLLAGASLDVDWYCDNCDAYLNDQAGFDDSQELWTCTQCGSENDITPSNLR